MFTKSEEETWFLLDRRKFDKSSNNKEVLKDKL